MMNPAGRRKPYLGRVNKYTWVPIALVLCVFLTTLGNLPWTTSILMGVPLAMFSLFIPIAAGYVCRFTPLGKAQLWRVAITHLAAEAASLDHVRRLRHHLESRAPMSC